MNTTETQTTNTPAWTPGPWTVRRTYVYDLIESHDGIGVAFCRYDTPAFAANARLIAAAPEMARTIQSLADCLESWWESAGSPDRATEIELIEARALLARINGA